MRLFVFPSVFALCLLTAVRGFAADEKASVSARVDAVLQEAAHSGRPVLAVAGYADCAPCRRLKEQLRTQPLVAQFAVLELTMNGDSFKEWKAWQDMSATSEKSSPQVFVVRADGRMLHKGPAPQDLPGFLRSQSEQSGQPLTSDQTQQLEKLLSDATALAEKGDRAGAMRALAPAFKVQSFGASARAIQGFCEQLAADLEKSIDEAEGQIADSVEGVEAAVLLIDASKSFSKSLPDVAKAATKKLATLRKKPDLRAALQQAELIQQADAAARQSAEKGTDKYRKVIEQHPGSAAATLAEARIAALEDK